jgi:signal transduction histidine kinase
LTVMRLAGDNLASGMGGNPDQVKRYGETIRSQAERLGHMVEQVLTFARSERPDWHVHTAAVHPDTILNAAAASAEPVLREAGCDLQVEVEDRLRPVESDANLMTAAVSNLLVNAARYGAAGRWVRARTYADGDTVVFEVSDRGAGMAARDLRRAFEPFYRGRNAGKTRGAGLGLHLVRRIAEAHGGRVDIESTLGAGTQVRIHLPAATVREEGSGEAASADRRG